MITSRLLLGDQYLHYSWPVPMRWSKPLFPFFLCLRVQVPADLWQLLTTWSRPLTTGDLWAPHVVPQASWFIVQDDSAINQLEAREPCGSWEIETQLSGPPGPVIISPVPGRSWPFYSYKTRWSKTTPLSLVISCNGQFWKKMRRGYKREWFASLLLVLIRYY